MPLANSRPAHATLGEKADSVEKDRKALSGVKTTEKASRTNYKIQEITSAATTLREFLTPDGVVFAVAWNGLAHPDLSTLLGRFDQEYKNAKKQLPRKHGQSRSAVKGDHVVVETWGHMRNLQGRAYVPALVPEEVNLDEIR